MSADRPDNWVSQITNLMVEMRELRESVDEEIRDLKTRLSGAQMNAAFYRSCCLSGETPKDGDQPYIPSAPTTQSQ